MVVRAAELRGPVAQGAVGARPTTLWAGGRCPAGPG